MRKSSSGKNEIEGEVSRKEKRKLLRKQKKEKKNAFYHRKSQNVAKNDF